eukprot:g3494.t1
MDETAPIVKELDLSESQRTAETTSEQPASADKGKKIKHTHREKSVAATRIQAQARRKVAAAKCEKIREYQSSEAYLATKAVQDRWRTKKQALMAQAIKNVNEREARRLKKIPHYMTQTKSGTVETRFTSRKNLENRLMDDIRKNENDLRSSNSPIDRALHRAVQNSNSAFGADQLKNGVQAGKIVAAEKIQQRLKRVRAELQTEKKLRRELEAHIAKLEGENKGVKAALAVERRLKEKAEAQTGTGSSTATDSRVETNSEKSSGRPESDKASAGILEQLERAEEEAKQQRAAARLAKRQLEESRSIISKLQHVIDSIKQGHTYRTLSQSTKSKSKAMIRKREKELQRSGKLTIAVENDDSEPAPSLKESDYKKNAKSAKMNWGAVHGKGKPQGKGRKVQNHGKLQKVKDPQRDARRRFGAQRQARGRSKSDDSLHKHRHHRLANVDARGSKFSPIKVREKAKKQKHASASSNASKIKSPYLRKKGAPPRKIDTQAKDFQTIDISPTHEASFDFRLNESQLQVEQREAVQMHRRNQEHAIHDTGFNLMSGESLTVSSSGNMLLPMSMRSTPLSAEQLFADDTLAKAFAFS